jgi:ribosomal protein S4E
MTKNHLKARRAPRTWNIARKTNTFVTRPNPGSQKLEMTLPLDMVMRNLGLGTTKKDINHILTHTPVLVNGTRRHDRRFGVGFQDVIAVPDAKVYAVLSMDDHGRLTVEHTSETSVATKLAQVRATSAVKGGKLAIHLSDGRNIAATKSIPRGATVQVDVSKNTIKHTFPVEPKSRVILTSGKHRGSRGTIEKIDDEFVTVKTNDGTISTKKEYAFVLGASQ